jgi:predicted transcriptional regulator
MPISRFVSRSVNNYEEFSYNAFVKQRKDGFRPTDAEMEMLEVLWRRGPLTVRELMDDEVNQIRGRTYTTILKLLQIMFEKGLVIREETERAHVYQAVSQTSLVEDWATKLFGGSMKQLMVHAISSKRTSPEDLAEIRKMLEEAES